MAVVDEYPNYRILLEDNRDTLVSTIDVMQFFAELRTASVFNVEDEQSITQNVTLSSDRAKAGVFLDKLATKGQMGFKVFLGMLETRYPELYKQLSGKEADPKLINAKEDISTMDSCQQHKIIIKNMASEIAEMANHLEKLKKSKEHAQRKANELQHFNDILKTKHNKNMTKLQHFEALQQTLKRLQHELNDLTTQQRNILATSLQLQQEKEAIQRRLRSANVEITNLNRQLEHAKEHNIRRSIIFDTKKPSLPRGSSLDSARAKILEGEIDKLRNELAAYRDGKDVDVEVAILRDDLRDKTAECEHLADEWQQTQKELHNAEEERMQALNDLEDARYACQNSEQEAIRFKQLYELNIKHSDKTEEDLKKAREDRNSLETHVDSLLREQRDLLYRLQDMQNKNMVISQERSILEKLMKKETPRRKRGGYPDLGYAGGSSESSKDGSRPNSMEEVNKDLGSEQATSSTATSTETSGRQNGRPKLKLNTPHQDSVDNGEKQFRQRADAFGTGSPIARYKELSSIYATLQRSPENGVEMSDNLKPSSSCGSIGSSNDQEDSLESGSSSVPSRPLSRQRRVMDTVSSIDVQAGSKRNRYTLTCFGGPSLAIDDDKIHQEVDEDDDDEDPYDYPELVLKRRSMSLTDIHELCNNYNYDFVEVTKPEILVKKKHENY
ncbi:caspase recruitment domain-containing protein 11-like isoform X2 [Anneissia japonica]|uniref:caspase recruitment domain-containing protein 11-like isoform X2 n=1 Tax=Anneissia japonica TaxID=1529436 RepID=UPI00142568A5|nr:caspase recruitment domain-containing protein 11-like isoform X2 [Anneissia japonica]